MPFQQTYAVTTDKLQVPSITTWNSTAALAAQAGVYACVIDQRWKFKRELSVGKCPSWCSLNPNGISTEFPTDTLLWAQNRNPFRNLSVQKLPNISHLYIEQGVGKEKGTTNASA